MKTKVFKRILIGAVVLVLLAGCAAGGVLALKKAHSMYKNVFDELDYLHESMDALAKEQTRSADQIKTRLQTIETRVHALDGRTMDYSWLDNTPLLIAHAGGSIDGHVYTNSREAFELSYEKGYRLFEIDFDFTTDGAIVASHGESDWKSMTGGELPYTRENVKNTLLHGKYHALDFESMIELLAAYPDAYVVTDTKNIEQSDIMLQFAALVRCANQMNHPEVLDRIIPQIYSEEMLDWVMAVHPFRSVIFTLYRVRRTPEEVADFCMRSGVRVITMNKSGFRPEIAALYDSIGVRLAVHTENDPDAADAYLSGGVSILYTDDLSPADYE